MGWYSHYRTSPGPVVAGGGGGGGSWQLPAGHSTNSMQALAIIAPHAGLSTTNRYYKQYPGIAYRVPVIVQGGGYPYQYQLTTAPAGMTIGQHWGDADYGFINWPAGSVVTSGSPFTVTVLVTDQFGATVSVTWTVTVTTSGFIFVDSVNGHASSANGGSGTGSLANPFASIDDWFSGAAGHAASDASRKADSTWASNFVIYRAGSYTTLQSWLNDGSGRVPLTSDRKPKVHITYPGESVSWDCSGACFWYYQNNSDGLWFSNMSVSGMDTNALYKFVAMDSGMCDCTMLELNFQTPGAAATGGTNPGFWFIANNSPSISARVVIKGCTYHDLLNHEGLEGYFADYVCIHDNTVLGVSNNIVWYPKIETGSNLKFWSVRGNKVGISAAATGRGIWSPDNYDGVSDSECCYNQFVSSGGDPIYLGFDTGGTGMTRIHVFRNSFKGPEITFDATATSSVVFDSNAFAFTNGSANAHGTIAINSASLSGVTYANEECVGLNNGALDASCLLTGTFRTNYLGTRGAEIA